jgi:hypothetical protein
MKKITIFGLCLFAASLFAQVATVASSAIEKQYFYDEFKIGTVHFSQGDPARARLNYNFVDQNMEFVNHQDNDAILVLVRQPNMTHIEIGNDIFVPVENRGFAQVIMDGPVTLLRKKRIHVEGDKTGGYGQPNTTASVANVSTLPGQSGVQAFINYQFPPSVKTRTELSFYLMKNNRVFSATRKNYLRLYSEIKPQLEEYLKQHKVDFKDEDHLRNFSKFANSLMMAK